MLAAVLVAALSSSPPSSAQVSGSADALSAGRTSSASPLGATGRWLTDAQGRVVILHGVNMVNKRAPYYPSAIGFGADDARFLAQNGFNVVRLGFSWEGLEPKPGEFDADYLHQIQQTQAVLAREGIYSLIDMHQDLYSARCGGNGFPDWATQSDGFQAGQLPMSDILCFTRAFDHFWANSPGPGGIGLQDLQARAWRYVASTFKDRPYVLGYNYLNEPWPGTQFPSCMSPTGCPVFEWGLFTTWARKLTAAIHSVDPRGIVWHEPQQIFSISGAPSALPAIGPRPTGFSFHVYCKHQYNLYVTLALRSVHQCERMIFDNAAAQSTRNGPMLLSEFGASDTLADFEGVLPLSDEFMSSWMYWAYWNRDPGGEVVEQRLVLDPSKPPTGANVDSAKLALLVRPYPQAVAGTPQTFSVDTQTYTFQLRYSTRRSDGTGTFSEGSETVVSIPPLHYPNGYRVLVTGAHVTSPAGANLLRLRSDPGATEVSVTVHRR